MSNYSNDNISKIAKLTTRELPHLAKTAKITLREDNGVYSTMCIVDANCSMQKVRKISLNIDATSYVIFLQHGTCFGYLRSILVVF